MKELEPIKGTTILLYDGECANERRRRQKRGKLPAPTRYTVVNEDVCENCGDCGRVANCMSLQKITTEFGAKNQIHQSSCNQDEACVRGECPSFVTVEAAPGTTLRRPARREIDAASIPAARLPELRRPCSIYTPGLGGTGVITANAILAQAAALDGNEAKSLPLVHGSSLHCGDWPRSDFCAELRSIRSGISPYGGRSDSWCAGISLSSKRGCDA